MLRKVQLHGVLADKFGAYFELAVESAKEACIALGYQLDGFQKYMKDAESKGVFFAVFNDDENIGENEIDMKTSASVIHIIPEIVGAGGKALGVLQLVAGAALVGLSFTPFGAAFSPALLGAGVGMMVGGAASLLMPSPKLGKQDEDGNKPSYGFGGAVTTTAQGNCVPVAFGNRLVGGHVISVAIVNEDL